MQSRSAGICPLGSTMPGTVRNLLTESSGMEVAVAAEGATGLAQLDPNVVAQALAMPIERPQGTMFRYSQRAVDLLVYVIQQSVGEDFQSFAQRKLFDPLGIARSDYYWARDRAGNTYGHAHLILPPDDFAKLVLLVGNRGRWNSQQVISEDYMGERDRPDDRAARCLLRPLGVGPYAYPGCNFLDCLGETPKAPFADSPPGCVILGCVGTDPRTPGIR